MESAVYHEWKAADERRRNASTAACVATLLLSVSCGVLLTQALSRSAPGDERRADRDRYEPGRHAASTAVATHSGVVEEEDGGPAPAQLGAFEVVWLPIGQVRGTREVLLGGSSSHFSPRFGRFFRGIPYGHARRFEPPRQPEPRAVIDATRFRRACLRPIGPWYEDMAEDCLHLNVFAPATAADDDPAERSPVAVWFHGGSYTTGAGDDAHREHVAALVGTLRVVVVTVNYRLGVLGFLGSDRLRASANASTGNFGILDQQLALRWVRRHIAHFGGDPRRISVFGWAAGAASASVHLAMPSSKGLFNSAVMMSGGFIHKAARSLADAEEQYDRILQAVGCAGAEECQRPGPTCTCLREADAKTLLVAEKNLASWAPTIDGAVLLQSPDQALRSGQVHEGVPIIIGSTIEDAMVDIGAGATPETLREYFRTSLIPGAKRDDVDKAMALYLSSEALTDILSRPSHDGWSPAYWAARRASADRYMTCVARRSARRWQQTAGAPAYWYVWTDATMDAELAPRAGRRLDLPPAPAQDGAAPPAEGAAPPAQDGAAPPAVPATPRLRSPEVRTCWPCPGATHGADLPYLFQEGPTASATASVAGLLNMYHTFFSDFVGQEDPNLWLGGLRLTLGDGRPAWPPAEQGGVLFQAGNVSTLTDMRGPFCDFWDALEG